MRRYLLDTGIVGDFINRRRGVAERVDEARTRGDRIGTCWPVVGELWFGVERSVTRELNRDRLIRGSPESPNGLSKTRRLSILGESTTNSGASAASCRSSICNWPRLRSPWATARSSPRMAI
jgi:hypothetical protein